MLALADAVDAVRDAVFLPFGSIFLVSSLVSWSLWSPQRPKLRVYPGSSELEGGWRSFSARMCFRECEPVTRGT